MQQKKDRNIHWPVTLFIVGYHVALFVLLPLYLFGSSPAPTLIWGTVFLWAATLLSITTGYHRLYSHKTYDANPVVEWVMLFFATMALQGSALQWSADHRLHHGHVDTDIDPYSAAKGFWYSHILWLFKKRPPIDARLVRDLAKSKVLRVQHDYYGTCATIANVIPFLLFGWMTGDWAGSFVFIFLLRLFASHHATWFINSIAHIWGSQPYSTEHSAVNNFIIALLTFGEGYHNYHHTFAGDYRNGVRWYQFDPPKYLIWIGSKIGFTKNLKRVNNLTIQRKLVQADKKLLLDHLLEVQPFQYEKLVQKVEQAYDDLITQLQILKAELESYQIEKRDDVKHKIELRRQEIKALQTQIRFEFRVWKELCNYVIGLRPAF